MYILPLVLASIGADWVFNLSAQSRLRSDVLSATSPIATSVPVFHQHIHTCPFFRRGTALPEGVETVVHRVISITSPQTLPNIHIPVTLAHRTTEAGSSARTHGVPTRCRRGSARRSRRKPSHRRCIRRAPPRSRSSGGGAPRSRRWSSSFLEALVFT